ncbi:hypothetical protein AUR04nite_13270 [Glutamicibacter uratoxydans]|uniref:Lipoprotein n=1 Tax=Glutamicibacter uratoxydans TaxID=43667 RepID=A0A4Y4DQC9_GLUUR|nr:hypothetical protein [Glutamicibacter uratoxydans]GED05795.1 hypothetical protein AUR04nite_13270 [Glutamicibacter uratoxydans]
MKRLAFPALGIGLALALQGCAAGGTAEPTATTTVTASPTDAADNTSASPSEEQAPAASVSESTAKEAVTTAYDESRRTVFTLDAAQISSFTGLDFSSTEQSELIDRLSEQSRWESQSNTKKYAQLIASAMTKESDSARDALREMNKDERAKLRVYVSHNQHATVAHIGVTHDDK